MKLPIFTQPISRMNSSTSVGKIIPNNGRWECGRWLGTAPYCQGDCSQCSPNEQCRSSASGDGHRCASGQKVQCCKFVLP